MAVRLPVPEEKTVLLNLPIEQDPEQQASVKVRQATVGEQEALAELGATETRVFDQTTGRMTEIRARYNLLEIRRKQAYLTLVDCNLSNVDGSPLFPFKIAADGRMRVDLSEADFSKRWGLLPPEWAAKIVEAVFEANPQWNPDRQGE
jgi:hypothetical protein